MIVDLALLLASVITLAKDGCMLSMTITRRSTGHHGQTLLIQLIVECGRHVLNMLRVSLNINMTMDVAMTTSSSMPTFPDQSGLRG
ncbi:hypothetical protein F5141DRAFT_609951 [Pisolithus sp. B1]|nr:hypothetical protein F5141DRAFT_609951 [Pisolithus sp. B1]